MNDHRLEGGGFGGRLKPAISAQAEPIPAQAGLSRRGLPVRGSLPLNGEGRIVVMALVLDVRFDHLIGDVAAAAAKIAPRPYMPSPVALPDHRKLPQQEIGTLPLELLDEPTDRDLGWNRQQHVNMIRGNVPLQDVHPLPAAFLAHHIPHPFRHRTPQHFVTVFGDPHDMQVDREDRV